LNFSIHPRTKTDVGYRLSRAALAVFYKQNVEFQGPIVSTVVVASGSTDIDITYTSVTGIEFRNTAGFEVDIIFILIKYIYIYFVRYVVKVQHVQMIING
jgi:hypothetical protein